jgi:hypothetical protein
MGAAVRGMAVSWGGDVKGGMRLPRWTVMRIRANALFRSGSGSGSQEGPIPAKRWCSRKGCVGSDLGTVGAPEPAAACPWPCPEPLPSDWSLVRSRPPPKPETLPPPGILGQGFGDAWATETRRPSLAADAPLPVPSSLADG